jgi:hypothetical protein
LGQLRQGERISVLVNVDNVLYFQDYRLPNSNAPATIVAFTGTAHDDYFTVEEVLEEIQGLICDATGKE